MRDGISDGKKGKYDYKAKAGTCLRPKFPAIFSITKACAGTLNGDETVLKKVIAAYGPMVVAIS